jgi:hypothetical protein
MWLRCSLVAVAILPSLSNDSQACNVPAFRYALERWSADPYQILVYHETRPQSRALELLQKPTANCSLRRVDVTTPDGKALAQQRKIAAFPWVEVFYPVDVHARIPLWSGPLEAHAVARILDSPARSAIAKRLLGGEVAVWVLIRSGREREDSRALQTLRTNLERASSTLRMPVIGTDLNGNAIEVTDFKTYPVSFGLIEVSRDDPREEMLVNSLLESEPDLAQQDEPIAFPVFGRGRALYALVGEGIQESNIMEACRSLLNWCSCEIKAQNPGTDLLISADWSQPFGGRMVQDPELPPLTGLDGFSQKQSATDAAASHQESEPVEVAAACDAKPQAGIVAGSAQLGKPSQAPAYRDDPLLRNLLYLAGLSGLVLVTLSILATVKRKNRL